MFVKNFRKNLLGFDVFKSFYLWLFVVTLLAYVLRVANINFGLPHPLTRPDEQFILKIAYRFSIGEYNPMWFQYPSLFGYIVGIVFKVYFIVGRVTGNFNSLADYSKLYADNPDVFYLMARYVSAFFGTLTVSMVGLFSYKLTKDKVSAIIACFILAVSFLHVRDSHFGTIDIALSFFTLVSLWFLHAAYITDREKLYYFAAAFIGLSVSVKYNSLLLLGPFVVVFAINLYKDRDYLGKARIAVFSAMIFFFAFFITTPFSLVEPDRFVSDLKFILNHLSKKYQPVIGYWYYSIFIMPHGVGLVNWLSCVVSILFLYRLRSKEYFVFILYFLLYFIVAGKSYTVFARYMLPLLPILALLVGGLLSVLAGRNRKAYFVFVFLLILGNSQMFWKSIQFNDILGETDNRIVVKQWIDDHDIPKESIGYGSRQSFGNIYWKSVNLKRYDGSQQYLLVEDSAHRVSKNIAGVDKALLEDFQEVERFPASSNQNRYDVVDVFYIPFDSFKGVTRPGANYTLYKRKQK